MPCGEAIPDMSQFPNNLPPGTETFGMKRDRETIIPEEGLDIIEYSVQSRAEHNVFIRSYIPTRGSELPLIIYLHGGGFVYGGLETGEHNNIKGAFIDDFL